MKLDHFVKRRKHPAYLAAVADRKRGQSGKSVNDCFRPSAGASKADLAEYHKEEMGLRRAKQLRRSANVRVA